MNRLRKFAIWLAFNVPLGKAAPCVLGFGLNAAAHRRLGCGRKP
jgi:hypothetical protein